jgi:hypothetical protein
LDCLTVLILPTAVPATLAALLARPTLLTRLTRLLARLLLTAALLLARLTRPRIVLLLLVAVRVLVLRHLLLLGGFSTPTSQSVLLGPFVPEAHEGSFGGAIAADVWRRNKASTLI